MGQPTEVSAKSSVKFAKIDNNVLDPEPDSELDSKTETPREKIQRQRRERHEQSDKTWAYVQDNDARYAAHRAKILAMREATQANEPINKVFCKSSMLPFGKVSVGKNREKASSVGNIGIYAAGSMDAVAVGGLSTAALSRIAGVGLADIDELSTAALSRIAGVGLVDIAGFAMQVVGPIGILLALAPTRMGDGTLYGNEDIQLLKGVETLIRFGFDSKGMIHGYHVDKTEIPKRSVNLVGNKFVVDLEPGLSIEWVPVSEEIAGTKILVNPIPNVDSHTIYIHPEHEQGKEFDNTYITPISETDPNDYILIFPPTTGLPPMYVVFKSTARHESGVVTGQGENITGIWLGNAGKGLGVPIPPQIADKLRGRKFSSFDTFRNAFWREVSKNESLMSQFNKQNQNRILLGKSPKTRSIDKVGKRNSFEIHHIEEIQYGGEVYNIDNLRIVTAKNHIRIHKNEI
ncbi:S-type pyocin domain-containing protein [Photobacterium kishitanii]|uniref:S-type pyocin domain-containing protein n=1 Tax=Photobacterium kishitanii TaxID=318456 RepID=UPI002738B3DB|nr:S-type pyocin domain-containing protein [Photobacterium kishitanii]